MNLKGKYLLVFKNVPFSCLIQKMEMDVLYGSKRKKIVSKSTRLLDIWSARESTKKIFLYLVEFKKEFKYTKFELKWAIGSFEWNIGKIRPFSEQVDQ